MAIAAAASASWVVGPLEWTDSDSLFYEAQRLELLGRTAEDARHEVFSSDKAQAVALIEDDADPPHVLDPAWVEYSADFYRRRWSVPLVGTWLDPLVGERSLQVASFLGYLALGPALLVLLVQRFSLRIAFVVTAFCLLLPPVQKWSTFIGVDSWGLALEVLAFAAMVCVLDRGLRWIPLWIVGMFVLSFTRDAAIALLLGLCWITFRRAAARRVRATTLLLTGAAVTLPAFVLFPVPVRDQLAYVINGFYVPSDTSWAFVFDGYPGQIVATSRRNLEYPLDFPLFVAVPIYAGALALVVVTAFFLLRAPRDPYFDVHRGACVGYVVFLALAANPQGYRLELIALPTLAVALAFGIRTALDRRTSRPGLARASEPRRSLP